MTKVDIVSGFLGAGKTTFIKEMIAKVYKGQRVVLIENEFGEIGIDSGFMKNAGIEVTEMNSGCICCTLVGDFARSLKQVVEQFKPERVVIEPSGVGKLSDVAAAVADVSEEAGVEINSRIAVVDGKKAKMYMKNFGEFYNNQIESATTIVISRTQNMDEAKLKECIELIREKNSEASIIPTPWDKLEGAAIEGAISHGYDLEKELMEEYRHAHHHDHVHRHYADIMHMLDEAPLKQEVRALAKKIFRIVGEAESRVHATPLEEVHFHETGAVDSIVDIVGAAACAVDLGITETYLSTIYEGQGHVWCQHGRIPVPAPAVAGIAAAEELDLAITNASGEMVTPTGAAIAAALRTKKGRPQSFVIRRIGMGAGKKDFTHANLLRAMIIELAMNAQPAGKAVEETTGSVNTDGDAQKSGSSASEKASSDETEDEIWVLEPNLDDCTGEMMGLTLELLLDAGARDVNYTPI